MAMTWCGMSWCGKGFLPVDVITEVQSTEMSRVWDHFRQTTTRTPIQPGDPRASLLFLTAIKRQSFEIQILIWIFKSLRSNLLCCSSWQWWWSRWWWSWKLWEEWQWWFWWQWWCSEMISCDAISSSPLVDGATTKACVCIVHIVHIVHTLGGKIQRKQFQTFRLALGEVFEIGHRAMGQSRGRRRWRSWRRSSSATPPTSSSQAAACWWRSQQKLLSRLQKFHWGRAHWARER